MRRWVAVVLAALIGGAAHPQVPPTPSWQPLAPDARVLAFGDSLTDGVGGSGDSYPQHLAHRIGRPVIGSGVPGETTAEGLRRLPAVLDREQPSLLILCLGINDLLRGFDAAVVRDNLVAMVRVAADRGIPTLLVAVARPGNPQAHSLFADAVARSGARLESRAMVDVLGNPALKTGLVHPNREGYRAIAEALARRLREDGLVGAAAASAKAH